MAPEQGPDSKSKAEKTQRIASDEESVPISDNNQQNTLSSDNIGWIYLLKKDQLVEQCRNIGIATTGFTVDYLRKKLADTLRTKRLRASAENLLREVEDEVRQSENTVIREDVPVTPFPAAGSHTSLPDAEIMSTVQKWNLRFTGETDLMEFLERVEELAECYNIQNDRLLPALLGILSGNALKWYRVKRSQIHCWDDFRAEVQKFFLPKRFLSQIEQTFYTRRQNNRERAKDFILGMLTLARQHPQLRNRDHLDRIYDGLRCEYKHYVRRCDFSSLDDLISMTDDFEALKREERPQATHTITPKKYDRREVCWRCKQRGHHRQSCRNKRILFCYYCGREGTFSHSCGCRNAAIKKPITGDTRYHILVLISGLEIRALIDTGASRTHINERVANHLIACGIRHTQSREVAQMADKSLATLSRMFNVSISFGRKRVSMIVSEIPTLAEDVILGMDFLTACEIEIRLDGKTLRTSSTDQASHLHSLTSREFLTPEENERLQALLEEHRTRFNGCSGRCTVAEHEIRLKHNRPIKQRYFPRNPAMMGVINSEIDSLLAEGKIEPSRSPYSSPIVLARKKQGGWRMCIDYRQLNAASEPDAYPLPQINTILDQLREAKFISSLDLKSGYWQIPLSEPSRPYTAFTVPGRGLFQWKVMPFGLHSAPATFQRALDNIIGIDLYPLVFVYLDDIIVLGRTFNEHLRILEEVFDRLQGANMIVNFDKCNFVRDSVRYLGHVVTASGIQTDPEKIEAVRELPEPTTIKELRRVLGIASWYRRFVPNFSRVVAPMTQLLKKSVKWQWGEDQRNAFKTLKDLLTKSPILSCPNFSEEFFLQTDASQEGLGAVLFQRQQERETVIAYASRALTDLERKYSTTEQECLAILWGIRKMRPYLEGYKFTVITDHHSLKWLHNLQNPSGRLARWALELQQYDFHVEYRKGSLNVVADCLSRAPLPNTDKGCVLTITSPNWYQRMVKSVTDKAESFPDYQLIKGQLFKHVPRKSPYDSHPEWKLCVSPDNRRNVLRQNHDEPSSGHFGIFKTTRRIRENYYWPGMFHDVANYVRSCELCAKYKSSQQAPVGFMKTMQSTKPWEIVAADFMGPLPRSANGNTVLLVIIDLFSKWVELIPMRQALAKGVVKALRERVIFRFGCPKAILTDNGVQFTSHLMKDFLDDHKIQQYTTAPYSPHENPTERMNRTVKTMIAQRTGSDHRQWDHYLPEVAFAINTAVSESTKFSPAEVIYANNPIYPKQLRSEFEQPKEDEFKKNMYDLWGEVVKRKHDASATQARYYNLRRRYWKPMVGTKVWKRDRPLSSAAEKFNQKLAEKYVGPYIITKSLASNIYELRDEDGKLMKANICDLKPYRERF